MTDMLLRCIPFLILRGVMSGVITDSSIYACIGESTELYQRIVFVPPEVVVSLFKNGEHNEMIAMWTMVKSVFNETFKNGYSEKVFLDKYGNLWIRNIRIYDEGKYTLQTEIGSWTAKHEVQLFVLVAPASHCKPKIIRSENTLIANVEREGCGNPSVTVYWLEHFGISYAKNVIKLQNGNEGGTYHACIEGPALRCTGSTKLSDFCAVLRVDENKIRSTLSEASGLANGSDVNVTLLRLSTSNGTLTIHSTSSEISWTQTGTLVGIISASFVILAVIFIAGSILQFRRMKKMQERLKELKRLTNETNSEMQERLKELKRITNKTNSVTRKLPDIKAGSPDDIYEPLSKQNDHPQTYLSPDSEESGPQEPCLNESLNNDEKALESQAMADDVYEINGELQT